MFALGLISHIVEEAPHVSFCDALAHTIPSDGSHGSGDYHHDQPELTRGLNAPVVEGSALQDLLDTMHIESDIDLISDPAWDKYLLVPPSQTPIEDDVGMYGEGEIEIVTIQDMWCDAMSDAWHSIVAVNEHFKRFNYTTVIINI
jgi:hypothetical protein